MNVDDSSIETDSDAIRVKAAGIGVSHIAAAVADVAQKVPLTDTTWIR